MYECGGFRKEYRPRKAGGLAEWQPSGSLLFLPAADMRMEYLKVYNYKNYEIDHNFEVSAWESSSDEVANNSHVISESPLQVLGYHPKGGARRQDDRRNRSQ